MQNKGFSLREEAGQVVLDYLLPDELRNIFCVKLFGKGSAMDAAQGDPWKSWQMVHKTEQRAQSLIAPYQVHGTAVLPAKPLYAYPARPKADGVFLTQDTDLCASLRFADCTPVVIAGTLPIPWVLLLHSGYVGTVKNISGISLAKEIERGTIDPKGKMWAWIAPSICGKCYSRKKTGDPSTTKGISVFAPEHFSEQGNFIFFDIQSQIALQLRQTGIDDNNIFTMRSCTHCGHDHFYSYRNGDITCRNFLLSYATNPIF